MITSANGSSEEIIPVSAGSSLDSGDQLWMSGIDVGVDDGASGTERIIAAAGAVESLEWELDRARTALAVAIERAASEGSPVDAIATAAGMTPKQVAALLWAPGMDLPESRS